MRILHVRYMFNFGNFTSLSMYLTCHNSSISKEILKKDSIYFTVKFGPRTYFIFENCGKLTSPFFLQMHSTNQTIITCSAISDDVSKNIINYIHGQDFILHLNKVSEVQKAALELSIIELIESCYLLKEADSKITKVLATLLDGSDISDEIFQFFAKYFGVFQLYPKTFTISPTTFLSMLNKTQYLGIYDEVSFINWLLKYYDQFKDSSTSNDIFSSIFQYGIFKNLPMNDTWNIFKTNNFAYNSMQNTKDKYHTRIYLEKPGSPQYPQLLTMIINDAPV